jgi:hypothetical protein
MFFLFLGVHGVVLVVLIRIIKNEKDLVLKSMASGFLAGEVALLVINVFGSRMESNELIFWYWILAAMMMRLRQFQVEEEKRNTTQAPKEKANPLGYISQ